MATAEHVPTAVEPATGDDERPDEPDLDAPLYDEADARNAMLQFKPLNYDQELEVAPGIHARWLDAGHILGSAIIVLRIEGSAGEPELTVVFSGDLGRPGAPILRDYTTLTSADYVLVETTYGGREHQPEQEAAARADRNGAPGRRGQWRAAGAVLRHRPDAGADLRAGPADRRRRDPDAAALPRLADGVEGDRYLPAPRRVLRRRMRPSASEAGRTPLDYPQQVVTNNVHQSAGDRRRATAVHDHRLERHAHRRSRGGPPADVDRRSGGDAAVRGLPGRRHARRRHSGAARRRSRSKGQLVDVRCQVRSIAGFSAHADESQLLAWLQGFASGAGRPKRVFLVHGDPDAQAAIEPKIQALGLPTHRPQWHERVTLE